jgi:hypothetical protein
MKEKEIPNEFWIGSNHIHCDQCSLVVTPLTGIPWSAHHSDLGVGRIGICMRCGRIAIQWERWGKVKWISIY